MAAGPDLNPLNFPDEGTLLGADQGPGSIPGTDMGGAKKKIYQKRGQIALPLKTKYEVLRGQLDQERESWRAHILDLKNNFLPYRTRWLDDGGWPNLGNKKTNYIIDNTPQLAIRTLSAGMMSGVTNPSRPWIRIKTHDKALYEADGVAMWCEAVTNATLDMPARSNYYDTMEPVYRELGTFGTAAHGCYEMKFDSREPEAPVLNFVPYTWGEDWIRQDSRQHVHTFMRVFRWTARQIIERFVDDPENPNDPKWRNISPTTIALWRSRMGEQRIEVVHVLEPNEYYTPGSPMPLHRKCRSTFYERGGNPNQALEVSGYYQMPVKVPRWDLNSDDAWGHSPAMDCLGDAKSLQVQQKRKAQAIDKMVDPPLIGDANLKKTRVSMLPGDVTWLEGAALNSFGLKSLYEVKIQLEPLLEDCKDMRGRIQASLYTDVFQMLKTMGEELKSGITATEIQARVQERILEMGPVLTRLNNELYEPQIEQVLDIGMRRSRLAWQYLQAGKSVPNGVEMIFPPPPKALKGKPLRIEYISILSQAMKAPEVQGIQQLATWILQTAGVKPDVLDKFDFDKAVDILGDRIPVPPEIIIPTAEAPSPAGAVRGIGEDASLSSGGKESRSSPARSGECFGTPDGSASRWLSVTRRTSSTLPMKSRRSIKPARRRAWNGITSLGICADFSPIFGCASSCGVSWNQPRCLWIRCTPTS